MNETNGKMEFFYQYSDKYGSVKVTLPPDATLDEALVSFEAFLRAIGYIFDGELNINGNFNDADLSDPNAEMN